MKKTRKVDKREQHIKKKLTAAILMLLISSIMTVTSTYAWFTLSTAPEVTGIQTTITGNGNLEIALANGSTWKNPSLVGTSNDGTVSQRELNITWGNQIDVSNDYGVNLLSLSPAALVLTNATGRIKFSDQIVGSQLGSAFLYVPSYGTDGRVSTLGGSLNATYDLNSKGFTKIEVSGDDPTDEEMLNAELDDNGLRAFGLSTKLTKREIAFINMTTNTQSALTATKSGVSGAIEAGTDTLAGIAVQLGTSDNRENEKFSQTQYDAVLTLLESTKTATDNINTAILYLIDTSLASAQGQTKIDDDDLYSVLSNSLKGLNSLDDSQLTVTEVTPDDPNTAEDESVYTVKFSYLNENVPTPHPIDGNEGTLLGRIITRYRDVVARLDSAIDAMEKLTTETDGTYLWSNGFDDAVNTVMNINGTVTVNDYSITELKSKLKTEGVGAFASMLSAITVVLGKDSGVFYDISELVGKVQAEKVINVYVDMIGTTITPKTKILSDAANPLIPSGLNSLDTPIKKDSGEATTLSDIYGFALDLIFRTNASDSNLLLQTTPRDRIYSENDPTISKTYGKGSTMIFSKNPDADGFTTEQMLSLMDSIRVVFIDENDYILNIAGLDTTAVITYKQVTAGSGTHAKVNDDYVEAIAKYVSGAAEGEYTKAEGNSATHALIKGAYYPVDYVKEVDSNYVIDEDGNITVDIRMIHSFDSEKNKSEFIYDNTKAIIPDEDTEGNPVYRPIEDGETGTHVLVDGKYEEITGEQVGTHVVSTIEVEVDPVICELGVNEPKKVSVLFFLDGDTVDNGDVANYATSMTATVNLQFASDADLEPMQYSGYKTNTDTDTQD